MALKISHMGETNVGLKRAHNEDNYLVLPEEHLFLVADGMGGHSSGEVASQIAVEGISNFFKATKQDSEITWPYKMDKNRPYDENRFIMSIKLANLRIHEAAQREARYRGMGTTVAGMVFVEGHVLTAHVGDSRVYLIRQGKISQITEDHSLLNDYIKAKKLTAEEIEAFPHKNVIVRALGMKDTVLVDLSRQVIEVGDLLLGCSDGLNGMITDDEMLKILLAAGDDLKKGCSDLIAAANANGGVDNVTVTLARIDSL